MKNILILSGYLLINNLFVIFGQSDTVKTGAYRNSVEFKKNTPFLESRFIFVKRNIKKVPELYMVKSNDQSITINTINKVIWGIYDGKSFFINAARIGMIKGYIKIERFGKYSYFKGIPIKSIIQKERLNNSSYLFGVTGAIITSAQIAEENRGRVNYILNTETGMVNLLTKDYFLRILQPYPELLNNYQKEENGNSLDTVLKYIDLLNKEETILN